MKKFEVKQLHKYVEHFDFTCEKHPEADLYIYGYVSDKSNTPFIWDEINTHLRGLILDQNGNVIQRSFPKFYSFKSYITKSKICLTDRQVMKVPDCKFKIYEKIDGSMAILYWVNDKPFLASQRSFKSPNALRATEILYKKYSHLFSKLNKKYSYIFEVIYPETQVIINYNNTEDIILLGIIDNKTGAEIPLKYFGFPIAKDYTKTYGHIKDLEELSNLNLPNLEGFVLHYENGAKIKIKFKWFSEAKNAQVNIIKYNRLAYENKRRLSDLLELTSREISNILIWEHLKSGEPLEALLLHVPEEFYMWGFESWFSQTVSEIEMQYNSRKGKNTNLSETELWNVVKPITLDIFDVLQKKEQPQSCTPMWNLQKRVNNGFL